jgi:DNA-directed RNA polymerase specialized sigma24 family protein
MTSPTDEAGREFPRTSLTLLQRIHSRCSTDSAEALNEFFSRYWLPLYGFLRASGESHEDASDFLQGFVSREILDRDQLRAWNPEKGTMRGFLKTCLDRFRKKERRREMALKRGGSKAETHVSIDLDWAEGYFEDLGTVGEAPDRLFDREWASAIVNQATGLLAERYAEKGKGEEFRLLLQNLEDRGDESASSNYEAIAARLGTTPDAVKQRMRTFRARFHQCLRQVVGEFVRESDIDEEITFLMATLRG